MKKKVANKWKKVINLRKSNEESSTLENISQTIEKSHELVKKVPKSHKLVKVSQKKWETSKKSHKFVKKVLQTSVKKTKKM